MLCMRGNGSSDGFGGQASFLRNHAANLGEDGCLLGWMERAQRFQQAVAFDQDDGVVMIQGLAWDGSEAALAALPPTTRLACRARWALREANVVVHGEGVKRPKTHVALDVQEHAFRDVCELQAKYDFHRCFTGDASRDVVRNEDGVVRKTEFGWPMKTTSYATICDDGR